MKRSFQGQAAHTSGPRHRSRRGVALMLAVLVATFLFLFGGLILLGVQRDMSFETRRQQQAQAHYAAVSGVQWFHSVYAVDAPGSVAPVELSERCFFSVHGDAAGTVTSRGFLLSSGGRVLADETLVLPHGLARNGYVQ